MPAAKKLTPPRGNVIAANLCALVNEVYHGNISLAAESIGVTYWQLWNAATGRTRKPDPALLAAIALHHDRTVDSLLKKPS